MFKRLWGKHVKNQRGLTLIELLATIVILGIISAIAIPSIGGLINNSKKDAVIANAQQIVNAAKIYAAANPSVTFTNNVAEIDLQTLESSGQIEPIKNPFTEAEYTPHQKTGIKVRVTKKANNYTYEIKMDAHDFDYKDPSKLVRNDVAQENAAASESGQTTGQ